MGGVQVLDEDQGEADPGGQMRQHLRAGFQAPGGGAATHDGKRGRRPGRGPYGSGQISAVSAWETAGAIVHGIRHGMTSASIAARRGGVLKTCKGPMPIAPMTAVTNDYLEL
jgi:hypothetical protein